MRVFVIGTGRCGTVTFSRACRHITNYSSGHETMARIATPARWEYPDQHIEVDPHLAWTLGPIIERYPDAFYVHLQRKREEVVNSWLRRGKFPHRGAAPLIDVICQTDTRKLSSEAFSEALALLYETVNANIELALERVRSLHLWLHDPQETFCEFWNEIGAEGNQQAASAEFNTRYNTGSPCTSLITTK